MIRFFRRLAEWRERHKAPFPEGFSMPFLFLALGVGAMEASWWGSLLHKHFMPVMESFNEYGTWQALPLFMLVLVIFGCAGAEALFFGFVAVEAKREIYRRWRVK